MRGEEHLPSNTFLSYGRRDKGRSWGFFWSRSLSARKQQRSAADNEARWLSGRKIEGGKRVEVKVMEVGSEPTESSDSTQVAHPPHSPIRSLSNKSLLRRVLFPTGGSEALSHMITGGSDKKEEGKFCSHLLQQCIAFCFSFLAFISTLATQEK